MGSQTIEILRQGVWASLTGGWFYDPHQTVFCNAIHLYLWLFLLCAPFVTYLYFAKTVETWTIYCVSTAITLVVVKVINLLLHVMYDEAQIISEGNSKKSDKGLHETSGIEDGGIELQEFGNGSQADPMSRASNENNNNSNNNNNNNSNSNDLSQANSAISIDYPEQVTSTIDLKVDVHRKNSSESSDGQTENQSRASAPTEYRLQRKAAIKKKPEDISAIICIDSKELRSVDEGDLLSRSEERHDKFLDIESAGIQRIEHSKKRLRNKLQRQTSLDSSSADLKHFPVRRPVSSNHLHRNHGCGYYHPNLPSLAPEIYLEPNYTTKSELAIEMPPHDRFVVAMKKNQMRKDSTSTMSAIQLPTISNNPGTSNLSSSTRQRRHSNATIKQQQQQPQLPSSIVSMVSMRRIKSTALEKCCPQPSYSNLSPHPNSVETINGRPLRNPPHAILPPPSASLVRNQHLNFFPKGGSIEPVYPIAEIADEKSLNESFILTSESEDDDLEGMSEDDDDSDSDDDDDDDDFATPKETAKDGKNFPSKAKSMVTISERRRHKRSQDTDNTDNVLKNSQLGGGSDTERPRTQSTDSENEINTGSQSPLLDTRTRPTIFSSTPKPIECDTKTKTAQKLTATETKSVDTPNDNNPNNLDDSEEGAVGGIDTPGLIINIPTTNTKSEDSGCPSSDCEQASASSKDMLLSKNQKPSTSDRHWRDFNMDANSISVDVGETIETKQKSNDELPTMQTQKTTKESSKSLGAIPKAHCSKYDSNEDNSHRCKSRSELSQASSSNSLSGTSCNSLNSLNQNILQVMRQTEEGWVVQSATSNNPYLIAQRGELPPLLPAYNTRQENVFPVPRKPYLYLHHRQYQPKLSSTRNRMQTSSIDTTASSRDEDNSSITAGGAVGGSGSIGIGSGWDVLEMKISERLSTLFFPELSENQLHAQQSQQRPMMSHMALAESLFWGHINLPAEKKTQPKRYYKFPMKWLKKEIKISMDRLQLLALFDRDSNRCQVIAAILVGICCSVLGAIVLQLDFYRDLYAFTFCFVMAGSQYSLLKSVQPDASSSTHGDDARYSRPIYFCLCTSILILAYHLSQTGGNGTDVNDYVTLFGIPFSMTTFFGGVKQMMSGILLLFPILFSFGLFAQVNTFLMYVLEQLDMHMFGGNAVCSLISAFLGVFRSILGCCMLYGFAFGGLSEARQTQHVLFTCFCALLVPTAYHLSRSASDFTYLWAIIKSSFVIHHDEDDELRQATKLSKIERDKTKNDTSNRDSNKNDADDSKASTSNVMQMDSNVQTAMQSTESVALNSIQNTDPRGTLSSQCGAINQKDDELEDPLPDKLKSTVYARLKNDFLVCTVIGVIVFSLHSSTVFTALKPDLNPILQTFAIVVGFMLHYIIPQMRKYLPWLCFATPLLKQNEFGLYESSTAAKVMWFEKMFICLTFFEKNILLPLVFISALTADSAAITHKFGIALGSAIVVLCGLKSVRSSYSDPSSQYIIILFTVLFFKKDYRMASETFLVDYFVVSIVFKKTCEFLLKLQFIVTYIAPWQITWGSAFHAFAQPFSVPHSAMLFLQAALSAILSTPLIPFLGSAIFLTSYVRPIKFWERDYNTRRIDHSNTRLSSQLERDLGADDNNLNSIFYEHLTRSLQHSLCGDLLMGRWGNVSQGDCFVLASDYLNCLVHIIELGNGLCTFQMRGLEFRGTYCQQREVEAISEGIGENDGCCCCSPGHLPNMLSVNAMFSTRWLAWQVVASQYILEGYSITDNLAQATLQVYEFRKVLITYYIKSIIYYTIRSPKLQTWLTMKSIEDALKSTLDRTFVDLDPIFNHNLDEDFDFRASGITRSSFCSVYMEWIQYCYSKRNEKPSQNEQTDDKAKSATQSQTQQHQNQANSGSAEAMSNIETKNISPRSSGNPTPSPKTSKTEHTRNESKQLDDANENEINQRSPLISLLLALSLLARRTLATATHTHSSLSGVEFFLHGLHALFKGDYRITSIRDEWVFADMDLLHTVVAPAVKMSLKLHQDHFLSPDEFEDSATLYTAITSHSNELVISHEADPLWRNAVLRGAPQLLALRHVMEDGTDEYRLIRLTKRYLSFRVIKLNRECVRGLWAGQQQELIYLRNRNPERGSIQNAKQALRNIINSSCDQPIGYPIYVSPLTTSYAETNEQLCKVIGGAITFEKVKNITWKFCQHVRQRFSEGCSSGSATLDTEMGDMGVYYNVPASNNTISATTGTLSYGSQNLSGTGNRGSMASVGKPNSSTLLAGFLIREREQERECMNAERSSVGIYRKRGSVINKGEHERRSTFPSGSSPETSNSKEMSNLKTQISPESSNCLTSQSSPHPTTSRSHRPNSSFSSGNLSTRTVNRTLIISSERKSKSEERQTSHDNDAFDATMSETKDNLLGRTSTSLPSHSSSQQIFESTTSSTTSILPQPPRIPLNRKVIIVDAAEIYDCLDLGRRIDVSWPNEQMRMAGGRSSWKDWEPTVGMVGYTVHYWQPNHPNTRFRSNFNRTLFLIKIGEHFVPVSESGVKEYNTIGMDDRFRNVAPVIDPTDIDDYNGDLNEEQIEDATNVDDDGTNDENDENDEENHDNAPSDAKFMSYDIKAMPFTKK